MKKAAGKLTANRGEQINSENSGGNPGRISSFFDPQMDSPFFNPLISYLKGTMSSRKPAFTYTTGHSHVFRPIRSLYNIQRPDVILNKL